MPVGVRRIWLKTIWRIGFACAAAAVVVAFASVALIALALVFSDDRRIEATLEQAADRGVLITSLFREDLSRPPSPYGHIDHAHDMYTECIAYSVNLSNSEDGLLRRIADTPSINRDSDTCSLLQSELDADDPKADHSYMRYWHGYLVYMRPLLSVMNLENYRRITAILFFASLVFFVLQISRWFGAWAWAIVLPPFLMVSDFLTVPVVSSHALSLTQIFLSAALVPLILERPNARALLLPVYVFVAGMTASFVSLLISPSLAPALIAFLVVASGVVQRRPNIVREILYAFGLVALWFGGYFVEWAAKWVFAAFVLGVDPVLNDILGRISHHDAQTSVRSVTFLEASWRNLTPSWPFASVVAASIAAALALMIRGLLLKRFGWSELIAFLALQAPLLAVVAWAEATPGFSVNHIGFGSRSFLLFGTFPLLAATLLWRLAGAKQPTSPTIAA